MFFVGGQSSSVSHFVRCAFRNFCNALSPSFCPQVRRIASPSGAFESQQSEMSFVKFKLEASAASFFGRRFSVIDSF